MQANPDAITEASDLSPSTLLDAGALLVLGLLLTVYDIGSKSMGFDETATAAYASFGLREFTRAVRADPNMSFYYVLAYGWANLFGDGVLSMRLPSAIFGALTVAATYLIARRLFGRSTGWIAALLVAFNPFLLRYAQTARSYSLVALMVTLSSYFLVREIQQPSRGNRIGFALTSTAALYAHFFAFYVLAAQGLAVVAAKRKAVLTRPWLALAAATAFLSIPAVLTTLFSTAAARINWIPKPRWFELGVVFLDLVDNSRFLAVAFTGFCLFAMLRAWREQRPWPIALLAGWLLAPLVVGFLVSFVKPMFVSRYLIVCVPPLILLATAGMARLRPPVALAVGALVVLVSARHGLDYYRRQGSENWRDATRYVLTTAQDGDAVVFLPEYAQRPFAYYGRQFGLAPLPNLTDQSLEGRRRVWVVTKPSSQRENEAGARWRAELEESFSRAPDEPAFQGVGVSLYLR